MATQRRPQAINAATKAGLTLVIAAGGLLGFAQPGLSLSEDESYQLCSRYPYNQQCEGYEIPIALSRREGSEGLCALNMDAIALSDRCKVSVEGDMLRVYIEQGEAISHLEARRTEAFTLALGSVQTLAYGEDESINQGRLIANTFLLGIWGALLTQPDKVSQIEIQFDETASEPAMSEPAMSDSAISDSAISHSSVVEPTLIEAEEAAVNTSDAVVPGNAPLGNLIFESERGKGRDMRDRLEQITGLTPRTSL